MRFLRRTWGGRMSDRHNYEEALRRIRQAAELSTTKARESTPVSLARPTDERVGRVLTLDSSKFGPIELTGQSARTLDLSRLGLAELPPERGSLKGLVGLDLSGNALVNLPDCLDNLRNLLRLDLSGNALVDLPFWMGNLTRISRLDLSGNALTTLPEALGNLPLAELDLTGNPLVNPPPEILAAGTRAVVAFLRALQQDSDQQWSSKMLVVGEAAVGKTSVSKAL